MGHGSQRQQRHQACQQPRQVADALEVGEVGLLEREDNRVGEVPLELLDGLVAVGGRVEADEE
jgi:hypothetical protein